MRERILPYSIIGLLLLAYSSMFAQNRKFPDYCTVTIDSLVGVRGLPNNDEVSRKLTKLISNTLIAHQSELNYKFQRRKASHFSFWCSFDFQRQPYGTMTKIRLYLRENISGKLLVNGSKETYYQKDTDTTLHILSNQKSLLQNIQRQFGDYYLQRIFCRYLDLMPKNRKNQLTIGVNQAVFDTLIEKNQAEQIQEQLYMVAVNQYQYIENLKVNVCPSYQVSSPPDHCTGKFDAMINYEVRKLHSGEIEIKCFLSGEKVFDRGAAVRFTTFNLKALEKGIDRINYMLLSDPISILKFKIDGIEY